MKTRFIIAGFAVVLVCSCGQRGLEHDASGTFEAIETIISSEATGRIEQFDIEEGQILQENQSIGYVDTVQLYLRKKQLQAQIAAVLSKRPDIAVQLEAVKEQLNGAEREQRRLAELVRAEAAPQKQLDDATTSLAVLRKQEAALYSQLSRNSNSVLEESVPLHVQIEQVEDQLAKSKLINRVQGTVITKYAQEQEVTSPGKALYKIANLTTLTLRAYVDGNQFSGIKIGQSVQVHVDDGKGGMRIVPGRITWVSDKAEFTPKTIQTKDERANLVYAIKISVPNDGRLKIGMYGEVSL